MNCHETVSLIGAYLDSELDVRTVQEVREHLAGCASCAKALAAEEPFHRHLQVSLKTGQRTTALWDAIEQKVIRKATDSETAVPAGPPPSQDTQSKTPAPAAVSWTWWLWPNPRYYAGLALVWLLLLPLHFASRDPAPAPTTHATSMLPSVRMVLAEQRQLLAELLGGPRVENEAKSSESDAPPSRSDRSISTHDIRV